MSLFKFVSLAVLTVSASACTKSESAGEGTGSSPSTATATASAPPTASAHPSAPATASAEASASATAAPSAPATVAAADPKAPKVPNTKDAGAGTTASATASAAVALKPASTRIGGKNFALDVASPGCKAGTECALTIRLSAGSGFHINKEYPYKFVASSDPSIAYLGKASPTTFSKEAGDFREDGPTAATMTVRFKPQSAGQAKVAGTYKMSVCSEDQCQIEQQAVELAVPVL